MIAIAVRCLLIPVWWIVKQWYRVHEWTGGLIFRLMQILKVAAFGWTSHFKKLNKDREGEQ